MNIGESGPATMPAAAIGGEQSLSDTFANFMNMGRNRIAVGAAVLAAAVGGAGISTLIGESGNPALNGASPADANVQDDSLCADFQSADAAANSQSYHADAFLPMTGSITTPDAAAQYVNNLFGQNGPLAGRGDIESLAAIEATVVVPAQTGEINDPNYSYTQTFSNKVAAYEQPGGDQTAANDCRTAFNTLKQVVSYNPDWAQQGTKLTEFQAIRGTGYRITGAQFATPIAQATIQGIEFKLGPTAKGLQGFDDVLISTDPSGKFDGNIYIQGVKPEPKPEQGKSNNHTRQHANNGGGGVNGTSNGASHSNAESNHQGQVPEHQAGALPGPNSNTGGPHGVRQGPLPSPNSGSNTSTETTTATTTTPPPRTVTVPTTTTTTETVPTTTTPTTTTRTTTTMTTTTSTTTTSTTPNKTPAPCDPNTGAVC